MDPLSPTNFNLDFQHFLKLSTEKIKNKFFSVTEGYTLVRPNSPKMLSPSPPRNLRFFGGFVPAIPRNIGLSPPRRFPNFPRLSTYFLVPKIRGKSGNPRYSPNFPRKLQIPKKILFQAFFGNFLKINDYF